MSNIDEQRKSQKRLMTNTTEISNAVNTLLQIEISRVYGELRKHEKYQNRKSLILYGFKSYSQNDEDGIIAEIFRRIGTTNKIFVEFGVGNGTENNTRFLLANQWKGLWIEGSKTQIKIISKYLAKEIASGQLSVINAFITKNNIDPLISENVKNEEIDLLSVDIDGNDYEVFNSIRCVNPRVIIMEYNAKFPPPIEYCMPYSESHMWDGTDKFGASLKYLENALKNRGYLLVACNLAGVNAFFIREDLVGDKFLMPYTAEFHYEPARYFLTCATSGHPAIIKHKYKFGN